MRFSVSLRKNTRCANGLTLAVMFYTAFFKTPAARYTMREGVANVLSP